jgi:hypothetical protein
MRADCIYTGTTEDCEFIQRLVALMTNPIATRLERVEVVAVMPFCQPSVFVFGDHTDTDLDRLLIFVEGALTARRIERESRLGDQVGRRIATLSLPVFAREVGRA